VQQRQQQQYLPLIRNLAQIVLDSARNISLTSSTNRMPEQTKLAAIWTQYGRSILVLCVFALFLHDVFGTHGYLAMRRTKLEIERVQSNINRLAKENADLSDEVKSLKSDPHKIESIARDELGLAKPNEVIIKIPQSQQSKP
jgi:cell division protein FtsL